MLLGEEHVGSNQDAATRGCVQRKHDQQAADKCVVATNGSVLSVSQDRTAQTVGLEFNRLGGAIAAQPGSFPYRCATQARKQAGRQRGGNRFADPGKEDSGSKEWCGYQCSPQPGRTEIDRHFDGASRP